MKLAEFHLQPRGAYRFDTWKWTGQPSVGCLPSLQMELQVPIGEQPRDEVVALAATLLEYARKNGEYLLDLIYAHYRYADREGWLSFWQMPSGVSRSAILGHVRSVTLIVDAKLVASVFVDPQWEQEHKLDLLFEGEITKVDSQQFLLTEGILSFA